MFATSHHIIVAAIACVIAAAAGVARSQQLYDADAGGSGGWGLAPEVGQTNVSFEVLSLTASSFVCPSGAPVAALRSLFVPTLLDRHWGFSCAATESYQAYRSAGWVGAVPQEDEEEEEEGDIDITVCPGHSFLSGLSLRSGQRSQAMRLHCSALGEEHMLESCTWSPYLNAAFSNFSAMEVWPSVWTGTVVSKRLYDRDDGWSLRSCNVVRSQCSVPSALRVTASRFWSATLLEYSLNTTVEFSCSSRSHYITKPSTVTCLAHGEWDSVPACIACTDIRNCKKLQCTSSSDQTCSKCKATSAGGLRLVLSANRKKCRGLPEITSSVTVVTFDIGDTVLIPCEARGLPDPSVEWNWDSAITTATSSKSVLSNHSLLLSNLSMLDAGSYWCTARNSVGVAVQNVTLYFQQLPQQVTAPEIIQLKEPSYLCVLERDTTGSVNCTATGFPRPTIIWERLLGDDLVRVPAPPNLRLRQLDNGSLAFFPATLGDFGYYRCTASNQAGSDYIDIILFVAELIDGGQPGSIPSERPVIIDFQTHYSAEEGANLTLTCTATGDPTPILAWLVNGEKGESVNGTLSLTTVSLDDSGLYECIAYNGGSAKAEATVIILPALPTTSPTANTSTVTVPSTTADTVTSTTANTMTTIADPTSTCVLCAASGMRQLVTSLFLCIIFIFFVCI